MARSAFVLTQWQFERCVPADVMARIEPDLERFGDRVVGEVWALGKECERYKRRGVMNGSEDIGVMCRERVTSKTICSVGLGVSE